ncbi:MAG: TerB family tellurite resistance protein [Acidobacteriota bacterium]|nr:TerB family tellurite resistance protein [Acidobacteriota bacterium]
MSILEKLFGSKSSAAAEEAGDTETVRRIVGRLESLEPEQARFIAAFAYILGRVAHADRHISEQETLAMEEIVLQLGHLPEDQAILVVQIAKSQNQLFGGTENFLVTREFRDLASREQRQELLDCLFAVSVADDSISTVEENQIRQISSELGFTHGEYVAKRGKYSDKREVMRSFRKSREK